MRQRIPLTFEPFKKKLPLGEFLEYRRRLCEEASKYSWEEKKKDNEGMSNFTEISHLFNLGKIFKPEYIQWTGEQREGNSFDAILYRGGEEQKVEMSNLMDEKEMISMKENDRFQTSRESLVALLEQGIKPEESKLKNKKFEEIFVYNRILKILQKKNKQKYKGYLLSLSYTPINQFGSLNNDNVRRFVFMKLEKEQGELLKSLRSIFKIIMFTPFEFGNSSLVKHNNYHFTLNENWYLGMPPKRM